MLVKWQDGIVFSFFFLFKMISFGMYRAVYLRVFNNICSFSWEIGVFLSHSSETILTAHFPVRIFSAELLCEPHRRELLRLWSAGASVPKKPTPSLQFQITTFIFQRVEYLPVFFRF